ncbi:Protein ASPARTIC PROTEASE IN GUARD CELL 2 [Platanthera zijinensis]|uniref:Protein ASPARTIC PROTEASE IN GUARD CELL 2 n=1 Tax=Platanthera zijinensis TaxID=2320716 RepID=A0AAP0G5I3_9ASPA
MPPFFLFLHLILCLSTASLPSSSAAVVAAAKFDYLNVHDIVLSSARRNYHRLPPQRRAPAAGGGKNLTIELLHRELIAGNSYPTSYHRINDLVRRDGRRVAALHYRILDFGTDVFSGLDQGSGEYFVRAGVGTPPSEQYLVVDSGSDVVWVQCEPCTQCYAQSEPVFDPTRSGSFSSVACGSPLCSLLTSSSKYAGGCAAGRCHYQVTYGDGSSTRGALTLETLAFGDLSISEVAIGCGHRNRGLFVGAGGLLGLGWGPLSFVSQLGGMAGGAFSYCLPSRESPVGELVFGRSKAVAAGAVWIPLLRNPRAPGFYYVGLVGVGIGGERLEIVREEEFQLTSEGRGGTVVDTGTAVTRLPEAAYAALREGFVAEAGGLPRAAGVSIFDTCYALGGTGAFECRLWRSTSPAGRS